MNSKFVKPACYLSLLAAILNGVSLLTGLMRHLPRDLLLMRVFTTAMFFFSYTFWKEKMKNPQ